MKIGFVVQRYGIDINGGAELHSRLIAEHLVQTHDVEIFTTCAYDYVTWKNYYAAGTTRVNGVLVHRFLVKRKRSMRRFIDVQDHVFYQDADVALEQEWVIENGPYCPKLISEIRKRKDIECWIMFSYRYWTTFQALQIFPSKTILVPTAEHDRAIHLKVFKQFFNLPAAIAYNSLEERKLINDLSGNTNVYGEIVGVGLVHDSELEISKENSWDLNDLKPYFIYIGRIDKNKGCNHLFRYFKRFCKENPSSAKLCLIGSTVLEIPDHSHFVHLGFVSEAEKIKALENSTALIMPSPYESLSMVLLESWRSKIPVIVNAKCEVLFGQIMRSNGGLYYSNYEEFNFALKFLLNRKDIADKLGEKGYEYYVRNYDWPIIMKKYETLIRHIRDH